MIVPRPHRQARAVDEGRVPVCGAEIPDGYERTTGPGVTLQEVRIR